MHAVFSSSKKARESGSGAMPFSIWLILVVAIGVPLRADADVIKLRTDCGVNPQITEIRDLHDRPLQRRRYALGSRQSTRRHRKHSLGGRCRRRVRPTHLR